MSLVDERRFVLMDDLIASCDGAPMLYGIRAEGTDLYKIGFSRDPVRRLRQVQGLAPQPLELIGIIPFGDAAMEALVHRRLDFCRHRGEWFDLAVASEVASAALGFPVTPWVSVRFFAGLTVKGPDGRPWHYAEGES